MERLYSAIIGTPIFEDDAPRPFTSVRDLVLDPERRGKLLAFVVAGGNNRILSPVDIISWGDVIKINSIRDIIEAENVLRVSEVLRRNIQLTGMSVESEKGEKLGKLYDFGVDNKTFDLRKIYVAKTFLGLVRYDGRIISAKDIIEILSDKIVVKEGSRAVKEEAKQPIKDMAAT